MSPPRRTDKSSKPLPGMVARPRKQDHDTTPLPAPLPGLGITQMLGSRGEEPDESGPHLAAGQAPGQPKHDSESTPLPAPMPGLGAPPTPGASPVAAVASAPATHGVHDSETTPLPAPMPGLGSKADDRPSKPPAAKSALAVTKVSPAKSAPSKSPAPAEPPVARQPAPPVLQPAAKKGGPWGIIAGLGVLAVVAGGAWVMLNQKPQQTGPVNVVTPSTGQTSPVPPQVVAQPLEITPVAPQQPEPPTPTPATPTPAPTPPPTAPTPPTAPEPLKPTATKPTATKPAAPTVKPPDKLAGKPTPVKPSDKLAARPTLPGTPDKGPGKQTLPAPPPSPVEPPAPTGKLAPLKQLTAAEMRPIMLSAEPKWKVCVKEGYGSNMPIGIEVAQTGEVALVNVIGPLGPTGTARCIVDQIKKLRFPPFTEGGATKKFFWSYQLPTAPGK